jgi:predicted ester cyclase
MVHVQNEEKKYSAALVEKMRSMQRDIELGQALKDELSSELAKAKSAFQKEIDLWDEERTNHESRYQQLMQDKQDLENRINELENMIAEKEQIIASQHAEIEKISTSFNEVETSALKQNEVLKNLMQVAENKIVEMKVALDKKAIEAQDYYSHLQQALTQTSLLRQENAALKDYVAKLGYYQSQIQAMSQTALNGNV